MIESILVQTPSNPVPIATGLAGNNTFDEGTSRVEEAMMEGMRSTEVVDFVKKTHMDKDIDPRIIDE